MLRPLAQLVALNLRMDAAKLPKSESMWLNASQVPELLVDLKSVCVWRGRRQVPAEDRHRMVMEGLLTVGERRVVVIK